MPRRNYNRDYDRYGRGDYGYGRQSGMRGYSSGYGNDRYENQGGYGRNQYDNQDYYGGSRYENQGNYGGGNDRDYGNESNYGGDRGYSNNYGYQSDTSDYGYGEGSYGGDGMSSRGGNYGGYDRDYNDYGYSGSGYNTDYGRGGRYNSDYTGGKNYYGRGGSNRDYDQGYQRGGRGWWDKASDEVSSWFGDEEAERRRRRDQQRGHRGKGPKNYTRSDDRIKEDVSDNLSDSYYLDASDIEVEVNNGEVTLNGTVDSRYAKREAEDIAEDCSGVNHVQNNLRVQSDESNSENQYQTSSTLSGTTTGKSSSGTSKGKSATT